MTGYTFTLTCPECESSVTHVNGAGMGSQTIAVAQCVACGREYAVTVHLRAMPRPDVERERRNQRASRARRRVA